MKHALRLVPFFALAGCPLNAVESRFGVSPDAGALDSGVVEASVDSSSRSPEDKSASCTEYATPYPASTFRLIAAVAPPLQRVCSLTPFAGSVYLALANRPLGTDGAMIGKYAPATGAYTTAFSWNRPGEPTKGGGGGQGFLRVHALTQAAETRLYVPDTDPPYGGLGVIDHGTEGYVFASSTEGVFPPPQMPHYGLPKGAGVLPRAYHVFDVAEYRGELYASTGSVPPNERAWVDSAPGALHHREPCITGGEKSCQTKEKWPFVLGYPEVRKSKSGAPLYADGVWRLTYLTVFRDALYAGIQDMDGRSEADYVRIAPPAAKLVPTNEDAKGVRVTEQGAAYTLRWYVDEAPHCVKGERTKRSALYWIAGEASGQVRLRKTMDGESWSFVPLPLELGRPTDIVRAFSASVASDGGGAMLETGNLLVLGEKGVAEVDAEGRSRMVATVDGEMYQHRFDTKRRKKIAESPFEITDLVCAAPLAAIDGRVFAGAAFGERARLFELQQKDAGL